MLVLVDVRGQFVMPTKCYKFAELNLNWFSRLANSNSYCDWDLRVNCVSIVFVRKKEKRLDSHAAAAAAARQFALPKSQNWHWRLRQIDAW